MNKTEFNRLYQENLKKLKYNGAIDSYKKVRYKRFTDGERAISGALYNTHIKFIPEYFTGRLKNDTKRYRIVDFYLPEYDVYIEHQGNWNSGEEHRKRYGHKYYVYKENNMDCVFVFPNNLNNISNIIREKIKKIENKRRINENTEDEMTEESRQDGSHRSPIFAIILLILGIITLGKGIGIILIAISIYLFVRRKKLTNLNKGL